VTDSAAYAARVLDDTAGLSSTIEEHLPDAARDNAARETPLIGLLGWSSASQEEIATVAQLRDRHHGPLVAVLAGMPAARG
jgi:hypothetical protein